MLKNPGKLKLGWILSGNRHVAGARLQGFMMHDEFIRRGIDSTLLHVPADYDTDIPFEAEQADRWASEGYTYIFFQKVFSSAVEKIVRRLRMLGVKTIYVACNLQGHNMVAACDWTIAVSTFLKRAFGSRYAHKICMIEDPIEVPGELFKRAHRFVQDDLQLAYVAGEPPSPYMRYLIGSGPARKHLAEISSRNEVEPAFVSKTSADEEAKAGLRLSLWHKVERQLHAHPIRDLAWKLRWAIFRSGEARRIHRCSNSSALDVSHIDWHLESVYGHILEADLAVIPCELQYEWSLAKSGNRLLMFMALGMPVIASPLPAYCELVRESGAPSWMIARSPADWRKAYERWSDAGLRKELGPRFRDFARRTYGIERVADRYLSVIAG